MLTQHLHAGNIRRVAQGVFASVPKHADANKWAVDRFLAASRLRRGGVIDHSALELLGCADTDGHEVQVIAPGEPGVLETADFPCRFVKPPRGFAPPDGVTGCGRPPGPRGRRNDDRADDRRPVRSIRPRRRSGRTPQLVGSGRARRRRGAGSARALARQCDGRRRDGVLAGRLGVPDAAVAEIGKLAPGQARYALGTKSGEGRTAKGWNVILPVDVVERRFEGP
jgi:hypothetical protein